MATPMRRRELLRLAGAGAAAFAGPWRSAAAEDYPTRPVRIIEGLGGGSTPNLVSRLIGQWLSEHLGQPFVVESRTGAGGNLAAQAVVSATPDGYTLLTIVTTNAINVTLYEKLDFDFLHDIVPIAGVFRLPMVLMVNPAFPATTLPEFIAYAKANPGKVNIASPGIGTPMHVGIELLKLMAGIDLVHVAYRGPAAVWADLFSGQVQAFIITVSTAIGFIRTGKVRPLAVTVANRTDVLPEVPTIAETLPGFDASAWNGIGAPRGTPAPIIDKLSTNIVAGLADAQIKARMADLGGDTVPMAAPQFTRFIADETAKWAKVVKFSGAKVN
jgi:tripartite-type tricarboxylate transporter receptor subunit TctC